MNQARNRVSREVNNILIQTYWEIGRIIVEDEQGNLERAEYGKKLIADLSKKWVTLNQLLDELKMNQLSRLFSC